MGISSPGIGSGLDVQSIVSQLVALDKQPLQQLQVKASGLNSQISAYGQLQSQIANLQTQAANLASAASWETMAVSSSNSSAIVGTATSAAAPTSFSMEVSQLARAQSAGSVVFATGSSVGTGVLKIQLGTWDKGEFTSASDGTAVFSPGASSEVSINITAADDTLAKVAAKINATNAGVNATVLHDASGDRLLMRSSTTGAASGFRIQAVDDDGNNIDGAGLSRLAFDPENATAGLALTQTAQDTLATINGVSVASANTTFSNAIDGLTLTATQVTTAPVNVTVSRDTTSARANITAFISSYNALNNALSTMTGYNASTKTAGTLQGDSTAVGLQTALRQLVGSLGPGGGAFSRLSDIGVQFQTDGTLKADDTKLNAAMTNPDALKTFFAADNTGTASDGLATRINDFASGLLDPSGIFTTKTKSLQDAVKRNSDEQTTVNTRADQHQTQLLAQYSRLDSNLSQLTALNTYITQQVAMWNKQSNN
jgi:flagellar hook-associated protein 2